MMLGLWLVTMTGAGAQTAVDDVADESGNNRVSAEPTGDIDKGRRLFNRCKACHHLTAEAPRHVGPHLYRLFERQVGSSADYPRYSRALQDADFVWDEAKLDEWLANPNSFLPGNKMQFGGLRRGQDRKDLIAFLRTATQ